METPHPKMRYRDPQLPRIDAYMSGDRRYRQRDAMASLSNV